MKISARLSAFDVSLTSLCFYFIIVVSHLRYLILFEGSKISLDLNFLRSIAFYHYSVWIDDKKKWILNTTVECVSPFNY